MALDRVNRIFNLLLYSDAVHGQSPRASERHSKRKRKGLGQLAAESWTKGHSSAVNVFTNHWCSTAGLQPEKLAKEVAGQ